MVAYSESRPTQPVVPPSHRYYQKLRPHHMACNLSKTVDVSSKHAAYDKLIQKSHVKSITIGFRKDGRSKIVQLDSLFTGQLMTSEIERAVRLTSNANDLLATE